MVKQGIDVSHWQGNINFAETAAVIDFAIVKAGGSDRGFYMDPCFERNYKGFTSCGIPIGVYYFVGSKFQGEKAGRFDAERFLRICHGKTFDYPLFLDIETVTGETRTGNTEAAIAFLRTLEENGCYTGFYCSDGMAKITLDIKRMVPFDRWIARYSEKSPTRVRDYGIWQYSDRELVKGIKGYVDADYAYKNYPDIIRKKGLNRL